MRRLFTLLLVVIPMLAMAQKFNNGVNPEDMDVDMDNPTFVPMVKIGKVKQGRDSIQYVELNNIWVYPQPEFKNARQRAAYNRLIYNIKRVLPIAKECDRIIIETGEYLELLPNKKAKDQHMKVVEQDIKREYTPRVKKLTYSQGKLLIKLIDRECNNSSYDLIKAFLGPYVPVSTSRLHGYSEHRSRSRMTQTALTASRNA